MFYFPEPIYKAIKGRPKWKKTRSAKRVGALGNRMSKAVAVDLVNGIQTFKKRIPDKEDIYQAWLKGNYSGIVRIIPWEHLDKDLTPAKDKLNNGLTAAMISANKSLPPHRQPTLRYDYRNPRIQNVFNRRAGEWITAIDQDTRNSIQTIVHRQFVNALSPRDLAGQIKNVIGLYPKLANAHTNYVNGLKAQGMSADKVERLGDKYYDKLLNYRSMMIARTESQFMVNRGQLEVWREGANQGLIPKVAKKVWVTDGDPCEICDPMDGIAVDLDDMWSLNNGDVVDIPTESHPHCYCIMTIDYGDEEE
jgi:hypothetical protein